MNWDSVNSLSFGEKPYPEGYVSLPKDRLWNVLVKGRALLDYPERQNRPAIFAALERDVFTGHLEFETDIIGIPLKEIMRRRQLALLETSPSSGP